MKKNNWKDYVLLHGVLLIFSLGSVVSKLAAGQAFLSLPFILLYGSLILILGIYALAWQQVIKRLPLTTAFANKAVTVLWGLVWGMLLFGEKLTLGKALGCIMIMAGILLFAAGDKEEPHA